MYTFQAQETQGTPQAAPIDAIERFYCHALISALPEEALPDLIETLHDLEIQFLGPRSLPEPVAPALNLRVRIGKAAPRPEFNADRE